MKRIYLTVAAMLVASFPALSHGSAKSAMQVEQPEVKVDAKVLDSYVGSYSFKADVVFEVSLEKGTLKLKAPGQERVSLVATSNSDFKVATDPNVSLTFKADEKGQIVGMTVHQNGEHYAKKISSTVRASKFNADDLNSYIGEYEIQPGSVLIVTNEGGKLMAQPTGNEKIEFKHDSELTFSEDSVPAKLTFALNDQDQVSGVTIYLADKVFKAKKTK
jgi:hypothetical protein